MPAKLFFSYSHADEALRDRLAVHLKTLLREGLIEPWHDRRLLGGDHLDRGISEHLEVADVILFLISPDFLASDYCYEVEVSRALERHEAGQARAVSIILEPCDWKSTPLAKFLAWPKDGKPVVKHPNHNDAYLEINEELRKILAALRITAPNHIPTIQIPSANRGVFTPAARTSNLTIQKKFRDSDRGKFLNESFVYIRNFFEESLEELETRYGEIETEFRSLDADRFTARIYREGKEASSCSIMRSEGGMAGKLGIMYQRGTAASLNTMEGSLSVADDGQTLGFEPGSFSMMRHGERNEGLLSQQGAADHFWDRFIQPLQ